MRDDTTREILPSDAPDRPVQEVRLLVRDLASDVGDIVRMEMELARNELADSVADIKRSAIYGGVAAGIGALGAIMLPFAAAWALGLVLPMWAAALIVAGVFLLVAGVFGFLAYRNVKDVDVVPHQALAALQRLKDLPKEHADAVEH